MKRSLTFVLLSVAMVAEGFAPRPTGYRPRVLPDMAMSTRLPALRASTLELQDVETEKKLPFYAKDAPLVRRNNNDTPALSSDDYQRPQAETVSATALTTTMTTTAKQEEQGKFVEFAALGTWIGGLSAFLLINNFVGPWPAALLQAIPVKAFGLTHALSGMLFGGGIILTTLVEWLATDSKNSSVLNFYFDKVPALDSLVVLPALTASILSGVGLSVDHYDSLGQSPFHVVGAISTLLAFAIWWASTDLTTQGAAMEAIQEWTRGDTENTDVPRIVQFRKFSNVVSCLFVAAIYGFMVLKPGFTPPVIV